MVCFGAYLTHVQTLWSWQKEVLKWGGEKGQNIVLVYRAQKVQKNTRPSSSAVYPTVYISQVVQDFFHQQHVNNPGWLESREHFPNNDNIPILYFFRWTFGFHFFSAVFVLDSLGCFSEPSLGVWQRCVFFADRDVAIISCIQIGELVTDIDETGKFFHRKNQGTWFQWSLLGFMQEFLWSLLFQVSTLYIVDFSAKLRHFSKSQISEPDWRSPWFWEDVHFFLKFMGVYWFSRWKFTILPVLPFTIFQRTEGIAIHSPSGHWLDGTHFFGAIVQNISPSYTGGPVKKQGNTDQVKSERFR